ncbi:hypothetical protein DF18_37500 [Streptomyces rimosus]|nr:hypothetical protein [Streptomyces rimosus]KEF06825.1 hypothetical protein DF18_37500 [Streptomyces rimosus]
MTCPLLPVAPKDDTAASRPAPATGQGTMAVGTNNRVPSGSMSGFHRVKCNVAGTAPCRTAAIALSSPAIPEAASACPMFDFTEPSAHLPRPVPYTSATDANSTGSPVGVPGPWASTMPTSPGSTPAHASAVR